jgi:hypothetical protein
MRPDPLLDPEKLPRYLVLSALVSAAFGLIIWQVSDREGLAVAAAFFLFAADYIGLKKLMDRDK